MMPRYQFPILALCVASVLTAAQAQVITAYKVQPGVVGAEPNPGENLIIGLDFDVVSSVKVVSLGVFDSKTDGIFGSELQVAILDRQTGALVTPQLSFTSADNGTALDGSRFKTLAAPVILPAGFQGSVVAGAYTTPLGDPNGNAVHQPMQWSFDDGGGLLTQVHFHYNFDYDNSGLFLPTTTHPGLPDPVFAAGTFQYEAVPEPGQFVVLFGVGLLGTALWRRFGR